MKKKKILFVGSFKSKSKTGHTGGMTIACKTIVNSSLSQKVEWILLDSTPRTNLKRSFFEKFIMAFVRLVKFLYLLIFKNPDTVFVFAAHDYSFYEKGIMIYLASWLNKRTILAPRSGFLIDNLEQSEKFRTRAANIINKADFILCQGTFWKEFFESKLDVDENKLVVINNCIDYRQFYDKDFQDDEPLSILFMGWIDENKGIFDLLEAMKVLKNKNIRWKFAGDGLGMEKLKSALEKEGLAEITDFYGWIFGEIKLRALQQADVFVLPSYREGLPNAVLEAMASQTAVICSNVGAIPDLIDQGKNGFMIEAGDSSAIVERINEIYKNRELRIKLSKNAYKTIKNKFSLESTIPKFEALLLT